MKILGKFAVAVLAFSSMAAYSQTNAKNASPVGSWSLDLAHSDFGSDPAPKSLTITVLKDTQQTFSWRVRGVDDKGKSFAYSWSGPMDGTMHAIKQQSGGDSGMESAKRDSDGSLIRHGEFKDGSSFDARATMSDDGNTINEVLTSKPPKGASDKESKSTSVFHRVKGSGSNGAKP